MTPQDFINLISQNIGKVMTKELADKITDMYITHLYAAKEQAITPKPTTQDDTAN